MMDETDDLEVESVSSDFSILPDAHESEAVSRPYLAANTGSGSISSHNQVEFVNVCGSYPSNQDLVMYYSFTGDHTPAVTDRLAIYRVGFTTPQDYLVYEWAATSPQAAPPSTDDVNRKIYGVTFSKSGLPVDASEFYQVCYLREDHLIRGVSAPFQLVQDGRSLSSLSSDVVSTVEQADGSVLVTTDLTSLHTNINMLQECVQRVQAEKVAVEEQLAAVQLQLQGKSEQLQHLEHQLEELNGTSEKQQQASAAELVEKESQLAQLEQERNALQDSLQAAQDEVDRLQERSSVQKERELTLKEELIKRDECLQEKNDDIANKEEELSAAVNQLQALEAKQELLYKEMEACKDDRERAQMALSEYTDAAAKDHSHMNVLERELSSVNEELRQRMEELQDEKLALERNRDELQHTRDELDHERNTLTAAQSSLDACQTELRVALERQKVLDSDNRVLQGTVRSHLQHATLLKEKLRESDSKCAGAERVAEKLSEQHQQAVQQRTTTERRNKILASKCQKLSKLILDQNVAESVEALVGIHDDDYELDEDNLHNDGETVEIDRDVPPTVACATVGDTATLANSDLAAESEPAEDDRLKSVIGMTETPVAAEADVKQIELAPVSEVQAAVVTTKDSEAAVINVSFSKTIKVDASGSDESVSTAQNTKLVDQKDGLVQSTTSLAESVADESEASSRYDLLLTLKTLKTAAQRAKQNWEELQSQHDELVSEADDGTNSRIESLHSSTSENKAASTNNSDACAPEESVNPSSEAGQTTSDRREETQTKKQTSQAEGQAKEQKKDSGPDSPRYTPGPSAFHQPHYQHQWQLPPFIPPPPPPRPPPPYFGSIFTAGQTAPVFFPPTMHYHAAPDFGENLHGGSHMNCHARTSEAIPMPFPPAFPMPPHPPPPPQFPPPFMPQPPPPPPPPPPPASNVGTEEDGLPPPLVPNSTESSRHAALLSTIGAAAQMASATNLVTGELKDAFGFTTSSSSSSSSSSNAPQASSQQQQTAADSAPTDDGVESGTAGESTQVPGGQEQQQNSQGQQQQQSSAGFQWQYCGPHRKPMFQGFSGFNNGAGLNSNFASHHNLHRGRYNFHHGFQRRPDGTPSCGPTLEGAAARNPFAGRIYERFRTHGWTHCRDHPRPGMRHRNHFERMCTNNAGRGHMFEETADDLLGEANREGQNAENESPEAEEADQTEDVPEAASASAPPAEEAYNGQLNCPFCPYTLDVRNTALFDEHIDSHLECICPICSTAFHRSKQTEFEAHVNGHFSEEDAGSPAPGDDQHSSGNWGGSFHMMDFD